MDDSSKVDGWTFVASKKKNGANSTKKVNRKLERQLEKARHLAKTLHSKDSDVDENENQDEKKTTLIQEIEQCMEDLNRWQGANSTQRSSQSTTGFDMQALGNLIHEAANAKDDKEVYEIVCYGIGNFHNSSSSRYNSPLIQLACVLLLRKKYAQIIYDHSQRNISSEENVNQKDHDESHTLSYSKQQELVYMIYFEPFIEKIEEKVLDYFHVQVLHTNEHGKRCIDNPNEDQSQISQRSKKSNRCTLFYMPHCPMRLYSNVLWANWNERLIMEGRIVLFGNSFKAYDERIISSERKKDKTNAIFPLLPFVIEFPVLKSQGNLKSLKKSRIGIGGTDGKISIQDLDMAFNDSVVMSFRNDSNSTFPERPDEFFVDGSDDSELF